MLWRLLQGWLSCNSPAFELCPHNHGRFGMDLLGLTKITTLWYLRVVMGRDLYTSTPKLCPQPEK